jgi:DNA repair protein RadC
MVVLMFDEPGVHGPDPHLIGAHVAAIGTRKGVDCDPSEILKAVLLRNAAGFLVGHNHIRGPAVPSPSDRKVTKELKAAAKFFRLNFYDHIIVATAGPEDFYSFAAENAL